MASNKGQRVKKGGTGLKYSTISTESVVDYYCFLILIRASAYLTATPAQYIVLLTLSSNVTRQTKGFGY